MVGVSANSADLEIAGEFFELFKTAWEPAVPGRRYAAALVTNGRIESVDADQYFVFGTGEVGGTRPVELRSGPIEIDWQGTSLPILGTVGLFDANRSSVMSVCGHAVDTEREVRGRSIRWIGYNLFDEVRTLLTVGQPARFALRPTLDLHIDFMRRLLQDAGIAFVEVPPHPAGYDFTCCLTHDIDFFGIRRQGFDRTLAGFVVRGTVGSIADFVRGRRTASEVLRNLAAVASLPLVFLRMLPDFWTPFESYAAVEDPHSSTFFVVPFKHRPGVSPDGVVDPARAVPYGAAEIGEEIRTAAGRGSEVSLHGIDAWRDFNAGAVERSEVMALNGGRQAGVRMHWLYFDRHSPETIERAGFEYDSTCGYNDAVGYRAGTAQAFRIPGTHALMELPLTIMDSAMFSGGRLALSPDDALARCRQIVANARTSGGNVVVNWHCRSLAPERLLGRFYTSLLGEIRTGGNVWFATASEAVEWFRWRRAIQFRQESPESADIQVVAPPAPGPGGVVRVYGTDTRVHAGEKNPRRVTVHESAIDGSRSIPVRLPAFMRDHV